MQRLLGDKHNSHNGLLLKILEQIEKDFSKSGELHLLLTQLVFNLTMPVRTTSSLSSDQIGGSANQIVYTTTFIEDKYKSVCVYILIRIIRLQNMNETTHEASSSNANNNTELQKEEHSRLLIKALQSVENLLSSIESAKTPQAIVHVDWLQSASNEYQLGDILAIVKVSL